MIGLFIAKATSDDFMPTPKYQKKSEASRGFSLGIESSSHLSFSRTSKIKLHQPRPSLITPCTLPRMY